MKDDQALSIEFMLQIHRVINQIEVRRECAHLLSEVFAGIFITLLTLAFVPTCLKSAIVVHVPECSLLTGLNDY